MPDLDVAIVGAGAAGIGAARAAARIGITHRVLEASHRIGGRAYTEDIAPNTPFDLGCHWLHNSSINPLVPEADRLGFVLDRGFAFSPHLWIDGRHASTAENGELAAYFDRVGSDFVARELDRADNDVLSLLDVDSACFRPYAHVFSVIHAADPDQVSARDVMAQIASGEDWPVRGGLGRLVAGLGADIPVTLNTIVEEIDLSPRDRVLIRTSRGTIAARTVLLTVSIGILQSGFVRFRPALPAATQSAIEGFNPGAANRIALHFDCDVFAGTSSNFTILDGESEPLAVYIPPFGFNYIVGQTGGRFAAHLTRAGQRAAAEYVLDRVCSVFGAGVRRHFRRSIVSAWETDPWVLGAYASVRPGHAAARQILSQPVDNRLFIAGEAVGMPMVATCGGAYWSGIEAIGRIAAALRQTG